MRPSLSHKLAISSLLLLLCQAGLYGQQGGGLSRTATSTITTRNDKQRGVIVHITNRRFTFTNYYPDRLGKDEPFPTILLLEEFTSERSLSEEGQQGSVKVEAWAGKDADASRKLWTIEHEGDEGESADRFYKVVKHGCCDAEDTRIYFNLTTGQKVFTSTADIFQVEVPNTSSQFLRYVAFHSGFASLPTVETENQKNIVGLIQYASDSKVINRVVVRARTEAAAELRAQAIKARYQQKISDTSPLTLWGVDGKAAASSLSGFSIVLTFYDNIRVEIPVANDHLDISRATVPKGLALQMAK